MTEKEFLENKLDRVWAFTVGLGFGAIGVSIIWIIALVIAHML